MLRAHRLLQDALITCHDHTRPSSAFTAMLKSIHTCVIWIGYAIECHKRFHNCRHHPKSAGLLASYCGPPPVVAHDNICMLLRTSCRCLCNLQAHRRRCSECRLRNGGAAPPTSLHLTHRLALVSRPTATAPTHAQRLTLPPTLSHQQLPGSTRVPHLNLQFHLGATPSLALLVPSYPGQTTTPLLACLHLFWHMRFWRQRWLAPAPCARHCPRKVAHATAPTTPWPQPPGRLARTFFAGCWWLTQPPVLTNTAAAVACCCRRVLVARNAALAAENPPARTQTMRAC